MKLGIEEKLIDLRQERDRFEAECFRLRRQLKDAKERAHWVGALLAHSKKGMLCWTEAAQGLLPDGYDFATLVTFLDRVYCEHPVDNRILRKTTQGVAEWVQMTCSNCGAHQDVTEWEPPEHMHVCAALDCTVDGHSTHHCECGHTWPLIPLSAMPECYYQTSAGGRCEYRSRDAGVTSACGRPSTKRCLLCQTSPGGYYCESHQCRTHWEEETESTVT